MLTSVSHISFSIIVSEICFSPASISVIARIKESYWNIIEC